jgi:two-component system cell cycle response regulator
MTARVLIVDDTPFNVKLLEAKLRNEYYEVFVATNGKKAIKMAQDILPDIILMDVMMPGMDGFEATETIKSMPETTHIPIIIVTALNAQEDKVHGLIAGADDFLTKPINDKALMARLKSLIRLKLITDELRLRDKTNSEIGFYSPPLLSDKLDLDGHKVMLVDDDIMLRETVKKSLEDFGLQVSIAETQEEAKTTALKEVPSVIVVNNHLLNQDALRLCTTLRGVEELRSIPIIIIFDEQESDTLWKALDMGINDYLISPVDDNELKARLVGQIKRKTYQDVLRTNFLQTFSMSIKDELTHMYNRRYFDLHLNNMMQFAASSHKDLSLMLMDVDDFKQVNDTYGHVLGDEVLRAIADKISSNLRATDLCARYGGEEFVVILPETDREDSVKVAERIRENVAKIPVQTDTGILNCTISIGIASYKKGDDPIALIKRADEALYDAKDCGKNLVYYYGQKAEEEQLKLEEEQRKLEEEQRKLEEEHKLLEEDQTNKGSHKNNAEDNGK